MSDEVANLLEESRAWQKEKAALVSQNEELLQENANFVQRQADSILNLYISIPLVPDKLKESVVDMIKKGHRIRRSSLFELEDAQGTMLENGLLDGDELHVYKKNRKRKRIQDA
ncbi:hypothetical protein LTR20_003662 [Exophiala xenobiotica]|nr:hypothetical protein LTS06_011443 [Exophiala xenobiotica]KAK5259535.1 hypothetical protein LTR40_005807 [Exophiala xenobiotica]KAK5373672.1 hypothetical protein LTS13_005871 [Exophiala xenobiotica]KAK5402352.1 hypothetical protein LTR79_001080 [Exophiala xenobiotica]KAK5419227.1 hypothetical protein LTR90_004290 [Exophiala xenobiotica]